MQQTSFHSREMFEEKGEIGGCEIQLKKKLWDLRHNYMTGPDVYCLKQCQWPFAVIAWEVNKVRADPHNEVIFFATIMEKTKLVYISEILRSFSLLG
ncbi:hypothetical protein AgCh_037535 [Apium graveolens]